MADVSAIFGAEVERTTIAIVVLSLDESGGVVSNILQAAQSPEQRTALADELENISSRLRSG